MSYQIDIIIPPLPDDDKAAFQYVNQLRPQYLRDKGHISPAMRQLLDLIEHKYPCLSSYAEGDERMYACPWADGPLLSLFGSNMASLSIRSDIQQVVAFVSRCANQLGMVVLDEQMGKISRPQRPRGQNPTGQSSALASAATLFTLSINGCRPGFAKAEVAMALAPLFKRSVEEMVAMLDTPDFVVKKDMDQATAKKYHDAIYQRGCVCLLQDQKPEKELATKVSLQKTAAPADDAASRPVTAKPEIKKTAQPAAPHSKLMLNFDDWVLQEFADSRSRLVFRGPIAWQQNHDVADFQIVDAETGTTCTLRGVERYNLSGKEWGATRLAQVAQEMPWLSAVGAPREFELSASEPGVYALLAEFQGRMPGQDEDSHLLIVCIRNNQRVAALTLLANATAFAQYGDFYRWLVQTKLNLQSPKPSVKKAQVEEDNEVTEREWAAQQERQIAQIAHSHKLILYAILFNFFFAGSLKTTHSEITATVFALAIAALASHAVQGIGRGMQFSPTKRLLFSLAVAVPVLGFFTLIYINHLTVRSLKDEGYEVGLMGAKNPPQLVNENGKLAFSPFAEFLIVLILSTLVSAGLSKTVGSGKDYSKQHIATHPCSWVGQWHTMRPNGLYLLVLMESGKFEAATVINGKIAGEISKGKWEIEDGNIHWLYASGKTESNPIKDSDENRFVIIEDDGSTTQYLTLKKVQASYCKE